MPRILVTGSGSVGKTTLVSHLGPELSLCPIEEMARDLCTRLGYAQIGDISENEQEHFKIKVLSEQISRENELKDFITDRGALDCWVLWQRWQLCKAMTFTSEAYYKMARAQSQKYTHVILVPPLFEPVDDGFRWIDKDYLNQIHRMTELAIFDFGLQNKTYIIREQELDNRLVEIKNWLSQNQNQDQD
ncbi:MAG: ATP-binding protein [Cyanobacteria bacterium TGS_CYA1]|nr:ATP-binding protein [Cyanobacteria bacterium TGS_CYA1]